MREEYQDWLRNLKVGDRVIIDCGCLAFPLRYKTGTVTRITNTKQVQIDGREPKFKNGCIAGDKYSAAKDLCMPTTDLEEIVFRQHIVYKLEHVKFEKLTTEQLRKIQQAIEE